MPRICDVTNMLLIGEVKGLRPPAALGLVLMMLH